MDLRCTGIVQEALHECRKPLEGTSPRRGHHVWHREWKSTWSDDGASGQSGLVRTDEGNGSHHGMIGMRERARGFQRLTGAPRRSRRRFAVKPCYPSWKWHRAIKLMVVDDQALCELASGSHRLDDDFEVLGEASNGERRSI